MTSEAVIVSTARTPIGKAHRGAFNATALDRAGIDPDRIDDEGVPPGTPLKAVLALKPVWSGGATAADGAYVTTGDASQIVYCRDRLGIDPETLNVNAGAIAVGHPFGMTGSRLVGAAGLFERVDQ